MAADCDAGFPNGLGTEQVDTQAAHDESEAENNDAYRAQEAGERDAHRAQGTEERDANGTHNEFGALHLFHENGGDGAEGGQAVKDQERTEGEDDFPGYDWKGPQAITKEWFTARNRPKELKTKDWKHEHALYLALMWYGKRIQ